MKIRNCTPHTLNIHTPTGVVILDPSGIVPRVTTVTEAASDLEGIPVATSRLGSITGLPEPEPGVYLVVSQIVAQAARRRFDLLFPGELIRDDRGRPVGCKGLSALNKDWG